MGIFDGFLDKMKLGGYEDEDDFDEVDDEEMDDEPVKPAKKMSPVKSTRVDDTDDEDYYQKPAVTQAKPARPAKPVSRTFSRSNSRVVNMQEKESKMEVCVIKPNDIEDGREIAETLLSGRAVVLNLEGMEFKIAQRIIDFTSGACFSIDGKLQKITNYIFIATPHSVSISGDLSELLSGDFSLTSGNLL